MEKVSKIRVLCILPSIDKAGGIEKVYLNLYKHFSNNINVDFITHDCDSEEYVQLIKKRGSKIKILPKMNLFNMHSICSEIDNYLSNNHYDIVHCNALNYSYFYFKYSKKHNIPIRIQHLHISNHADKLFNSIRNYFLYLLSIKYTTHRLSCSKYAGDKVYKNQPFDIIYNSIEFNKFEYNIKKRDELRRKYNIKNNDILLGSIGRMVNAKNQLFLIDLLEKLPDNYKLVLIGDGPLKNKISKKVNKKKLSKNVLFIEPKSDIQNYYQMLDLVIMPSKTEGLPMVAIESQVSGLKVIMSNNVTNEVDMSDNCVHLDINNKDIWIQSIINNSNYHRKSMLDIFYNSKYDINVQSKKLEKIYIELSRYI